MGKSITEKILEDHLVTGSLVSGADISIRIDQTLTQDATGTLAYLQFEALGLDRIRAGLAVSYVDHNTMQVGFENADDHAFLKSAARKYGAIFSKPGNGVCHQLHLERFGVPGRTLLGSDSHTPTGGGLGMLAMGAGGIDVAVAMGGGPFHLTCPRVVKIELVDALRPWVAAKDVILQVLALFSTKGNVGSVFEYGGPGVAALSVPERATIANMGAECGVTSSVFPSDDVTRRFLEAQGRGHDWRPLAADPDATYDRVVSIDLSVLEPLVAAPHSPGNIMRVADVVGRRVDQVLIGSCTNSSYRDLKTVALLLQGRQVHPDVSVGIAPGSRQVMSMLAHEGLLTSLVDAGVRLLENACGFCIGNSQSPGTGGISVRTSNRNFEGRSGTDSAGVFLASVETAVAAALTGMLTDPRTLGLACPGVCEPDRFAVDDTLFLYRDTAGLGQPVNIVRGPNIGSVPRGEPMLGRLSGVATIKVGDKITTDHIMPAGPRLKLRSNVPAYARYVFEHIDPDFARRAADHRDAGLHNFIIAGDSYGQGSSREHAAMCPMFLGVKAVVAKSIERIHLANLMNVGIIPFVFEQPADYDQIMPSDRLEVENVRDAIRGDGRVVLLDLTRGARIPLRVSLTDRQRELLLNGGLLGQAGSRR